MKILSSTSLGTDPWGAPLANVFFLDFEPWNLAKEKETTNVFYFLLAFPTGCLFNLFYHFRRFSHLKLSLIL